MSATGLGLIGDIGATNARLALVQPDGVTTAARTYVLNDYASLTDLIDAYLAQESARPEQAVLAVASPINGDRVTFTNHPWTFSIEAVRKSFGFERLRVINDLAANALAIPHLADDDRFQIGPGSPLAGAPVGVIGPGTGLGVSALMPVPGGWAPIEGEGGHVTMAPFDAQESAVLDVMRGRYDHVSAERVLSGSGLVNLYGVICELAAAPAAPFDRAADHRSADVGGGPARTRRHLDVLRDAGSSGRQSRADARRARRRLYHGRHCPEAGRRFR